MQLLFLFVPSLLQHPLVFYAAVYTTYLEHFWTLQLYRNVAPLRRTLVL